MIAIHAETGRKSWAFYNTKNKIRQIFVQSSGAHDGKVDIVLVGEKEVVHMDSYGYV